MKILHTSDWHLGKRLRGKPRADEQRALLGELVSVARENKVDITVVAGDVFDTFVPPSDAEELFYGAALALSEFCVPLFIAGNHDDADRLLAPHVLARHKGVLLLGEDAGEFDIEGEFGGTHTRAVCDGKCVRITRGGQTVTVAFLGYPTSARLLDRAGDADYAETVSAMIRERCSGFEKGGINIFLSHLFVTGAETQLTDERELGGSKLLPLGALRIENCTYAALGHVHKPFCVSKKDRVYYSGSLARYDFSDVSEKRAVLIDTDGEKTEIKDLPLSGGKRLLTVRAGSEDEALAALAAHEDDFVQIEYYSPSPLPARALSEMSKHACFCGLNAVAAMNAAASSVRRGRTDSELFELFYESRTDSKPPKELMELFIKAMSGEEL